MWGWGWWLGERDERVGCGGGKVVRGAERVSHMVLIIIWRHLKTPEGGSFVSARMRTLSALSALGFFFFFFLNFSPPSPSPGASQQSRVVSKRGPGEPSECGHQTQSWVSTGKCNFKQWISALWLNSCCFPLGTYHFSSGWRVICCPWCGIISLLLTSGDFCWKKENLCGM